jgi:hypothetical protein
MKLHDIPEELDYIDVNITSVVEKRILALD